MLRAMEEDRCHGDWQGPSDDECVDDLLVVACEELRGHKDLHHGRCDDGLRVMWVKGTGNLLLECDGSIYRRQFARTQYVGEPDSQNPKGLREGEG